jgi:hypothetical protein
LLFCHTQEYTAATLSKGLVQHLPAFLILDPATTLNQFDNLLGRREAQLPGQGSLQILLKELASQAIAELEV